ncbi:MAG: putative LPS assembly protein LptD [Bacteroidota bacterium]
MFLILFFQNTSVWAQNTSNDTIPPKDTSQIPQTLSLDTIPPIDTNQITQTVNIDTILISESALKAKVEYSATDSMISDITGKKLYLYGNANVKYEDLDLTAAKIMLDWEANIAEAEYMLDSTGQRIGIPEFKQGEQNFTANRMRYNFSTGKGKLYDISTLQNDITVRGREVKIVQTEGEEGDSTKAFVANGRGTIFTTCTHDPPHFGIRTSSYKAISNKLAVFGPANVEIMGVPTPLVLPFGFFPLKQGRSTGLLFPRDYEYSRQWGFGLRDVGWFFPLGEHMNLSLRSNIYVKGTWGINANSRYNKRYKYSGNFTLGYDARRNEATDGSIIWNRSFLINWSHQQAAQAHPTNKFGGSINIQFNGYQSNVFNDAAFVLNNQLSSNFGFSKKWIGKPYNLSVTLNHSQNTQTNAINLTFPNVRFSTGTLYPFKPKTGNQKPNNPLQNMVISYTGEAKSQFSGVDTSFFSSETFDDARLGVQHNVRASTSLKLLKFFSLNPSVTYREVWNFKEENRIFDPTPTVEFDTIFNADNTAFQVIADTTQFGSIITDTLFRFAPFREYSFNMNLNTQIFGTLRFKRGKLLGIRHTIKPNIGFAYSPNYLEPELDYYRTVQQTTEDPEDLLTYSRFSGTAFGDPSRAGERMALTYSFQNNLEAKYIGKDSTEKKMKIFQNLNVSGSYNFAADSLNFSQVSVSGATSLFKNVTTFRINATFDPYAADENGRRVNRFALNENGQLLRFVGATARVATNMTVAKFRALFQGKDEAVDDGSRRNNQQRPGLLEEPDFLSLFENFSINHNFAVTWDGVRDTSFVSTNSLNVRGSIKLTKNWNINISNIGYDFVRNNITYPSLGFSRDLHCWELGYNWQPSRGTYSFFLRVKPGSLDFLKLPWQQNNADARVAF